jgi:hypothetical protein
MLYLIKLQKVTADKIKEKLQKCNRLEKIKAQLSFYDISTKMKVKVNSVVTI